MRRFLPVVLALCACGGGGGSGSSSLGTKSALQTITVDPGDPAANGSVVLPDGTLCQDRTCTISAAAGSSIHLAARGALLVRFDSWTDGPCAGSTATGCTFTVTSELSVQAHFSKLVGVQLSLTGFGHGSVVQGAQEFRDNDSFLLAPGDGCLHAVPDAGSTFAGWRVDGDDPPTVGGTGDLCLTGDFSVKVEASFLLDPVPGQFVVHAGMSGAGHGRVFSVPEGIDFATTPEGAFVVRKGFVAKFQPATAVVLKAEAAEGSRFAGWTGDCSGGGDCVLTGAGSGVALFAVDLIEARYDVEDLGDISPLGAVGGIGPDGTVFGAAAAADGHTVAFVARDRIELLPLGDGHNSAATGVNASGAVVGWLGFEPQSRGNAGRPSQAFRFSSGKVDLLADRGSVAVGIDATGVVAVTSGNRGFVWDTALHDLPGTASGCSALTASAIADNGIVSGSIECPGDSDSRAALFVDGVAHDLSAGVRAVVATAVNSKGEAVLMGDDLRTYFWNGAVAVPAPDGYFFSFLDDEGHLSGGHRATDPVLDQSFAVLFDGAQPLNLNALVDAPQWTIRTAAGIDRQGRIAALGELAPFERHALRLVPRATRP